MHDIIPYWLLLCATKQQQTAGLHATCLYSYFQIPYLVDMQAVVVVGAVGHRLVLN